MECKTGNWKPNWSTKEVEGLVQAVTDNIKVVGEIYAVVNERGKES